MTGMLVRVAGLIFAFLILLGAAWLAGLIWFVATVPDRVEDPDTHSDAIVVLTGGHGRIEEGVVLLRLGMAKRLFVSGVEPGVEIPEMLKRAHVVASPEDSAIVLGHDAESTAANADETAAWMRAQDYRSLRLVTANYHMRRSLLEFRHAMPDLTIIPHPIFPDAVKQSRWWMWPGTIRLMAAEYTKYLIAAATLSLEPAPEPAK